jgi:cell division protein FtsL
MVAIHRPALPASRAFLRRRQGLVGVALAGMLAIAAMAFQVNQLSSATVTSYEINALNRERASRQAEIHELEKEVAELSSLARVDLDARLRLDMRPATRKLYVEVAQPLPETQTLPTRFLPIDTGGTGPGQESIWVRFLRSLPFF